ncbi:MAG: helix-turn-helix domain-containing protein, partial [Bacillota bacterium]
NLLRRHLTREQKQALALRLRQQGWTQERIAQVIGVDQSTVGRWLQDVMQMHHVDEESGKPVLPSTITDTRGRVQPARKPKRQPAPVAKEPGAGEAAVPSITPTPRTPSEERPAEAASSVSSAPQPAAPAEEAPAPASEPSTPRPAAEAIPGEGAAPASKPGAAAPPAAPAPVESTDAWAYVQRCLPERLPEPGPLDGEAYARAAAFEAALAVLGRIVRQVDEGRRVVRVWRTWREHHGDAKALDEAVRLLEAAARHLKTLGPVVSAATRPSSGRPSAKA